METLRERMVRTQLERRDITDPSVLEAMRRVERHRFVPDELRHEAYDDRPLPIGEHQTISQPYIVAFMTQAIRPTPEMRVLEVGTGCGYQTAVLAELVREVYTIEINERLGRRAQVRLEGLGYGNVHARIGDGFYGWPEQTPFDGIVVTAAPPRIPDPLIEQLGTGGRLVIPVGESWQDLVLVVRGKDGGISRSTLFPVRFVPMTGRTQGV